MLIAVVVAVATDPALAKEHPSRVVSQEFQASIPRHFTRLTADQCSSPRAIACIWLIRKASLVPALHGNISRRSVSIGSRERVHTIGPRGWKHAIRTVTGEGERLHHPIGGRPVRPGSTLLV